MPHVTSIIGDEVGIQYQGVKDGSSVLGATRISGLIVGKFKRGRTDKPMTITRKNIKGMLGYDPSNPDYKAVSDTLDGGVPSVEVIRIVEGMALPDFPNILEENIDSYISYTGWFGSQWRSDIEWYLEVNSVLYKQTSPKDPVSNYMDGSLKQIIIDHNLPFETFEDSSGGGSISLTEIGEYKLRFIPMSLTTNNPDNYPTHTEGAIPVIDPLTKIWSLILRKIE